MGCPSSDRTRPPPLTDSTEEPQSGQHAVTATKLVPIVPSLRPAPNGRKTARPVYPTRLDVPGSAKVQGGVRALTPRLTKSIVFYRERGEAGASEAACRSPAGPRGRSPAVDSLPSRRYIR